MTSVRIVKPLALLMLVAVTFLPLLLIARGGTDFDRYMYWGLAFRYADVLQLRSSTLTPSHIPLSQWSFGPGLIFSPGFFFSKLSGAIYVGWIFTVLFWVTYAGVLCRLLDNSRKLVVLGLLLTFVGTPVGYYSSRYSSESLSYACLSAAMYWLLVRRDKHTRVSDYGVVGICLSLLLALRPQYILYCIPLLVQVYCDLYRAYTSSLMSPPRIAVRAAAVHFPIVLSITAIGITNFWMTGSPYSTPYVYGFGDFKSMDWAEPEFWAVLAHPFHGLLVWHPLYALAFCAAMALFCVLTSRPVRIVAGTAIVAVLMHLYIHAAWFWWWLADSFGMRGMSIAAVFLLPALMYGVARQRQSVTAYRLLILAMLICSSWSFALLLQPESICLDYRGIGIVVSKSFEFMTNNIPLVLVALAGALAAAALIRGCDWFERTTIVVLLAMVSFYVAYNMSLLGSMHNYVIYSAIFVMPALICVTVITVSDIHDICSVPIIVYYVICLVIFIRMSIATFGLVNSKAINERDYKYVSPVDVDLLSVCYNQYVDIPGFERKKERLRQFRDYMESRYRNSHYVP